MPHGARPTFHGAGLQSAVGLCTSRKESEVPPTNYVPDILCLMTIGIDLVSKAPIGRLTKLSAYIRGREDRV